MTARAALGIALGLLARLWLSTLRLVVIAPTGHEPDPRPWLLAFFHGQQFALLGWRRRRATAVLVSLSADGEIQASALPRLGLVVRRGSSSRGGARGLAALVRLVRQGLDAAFAVDGPRGPRGVVHPGVVAAARHTRGVVVPLACASSRSWVLRRAWDRYELPWPFCRVVVCLGPALDVGGLDDDQACERVRQGIEACEARARASLAAAAARTGQGAPS